MMNPEVRGSEADLKEAQWAETSEWWREPTSPEDSQTIKTIRAKLQSGKTIKLNMGAGVQKYEGYIGVDIDPNMPAADLIHDLTEPLLLPDECVSHIHCCHMLEHMTRWDALSALTEWRRLLCKDGILWGFVPDGEEVARMFLESMGPEGDEWTHRKMTQMMLGGNSWDHTVGMTQSHHMLYDQWTLRSILYDSGFSLVQVDKQSVARFDQRLAFYAIKRQGPAAFLEEPKWKYSTEEEGDE